GLRRRHPGGCAGAGAAGPAAAAERAPGGGGVVAHGGPASGRRQAGLAQLHWRRSPGHRERRRCRDPGPADPRRLGITARAGGSPMNGHAGGGGPMPLPCYSVRRRLSSPHANSPELLVANIPADLLYTPEHEWVRKTSDPKVVEIGITDFAQGEL